MRLFRWIFSWLQPISPAAAAWLAERLFFTARRSRLTPDARAFLATGARFTLDVEGRHVVGWRWGALDTAVIYLVHGWGSRGARLAAFVQPLRTMGFAVVTYDTVGQGESARGLTSMPEFARTLLAVAARHGTPRAIVAHSMGCAGTTLAMSWGLETGRLVFLAPAADPPAWVAPFAKQLDVRSDVLERVRARSERRLRVRWADLNVPQLARALPARPELLVVHDEADETVRWQDGAAIAAAWPNSRLVTTQGLGHRGVTNDPAVVRQAVDFLTAGRRAVGLSPRAEHEALEYALFNREDRRASGGAGQLGRGSTHPG